jgi:magnesium transporter
VPEEIVIERADLRWHHFDDPEDPELVVLAAQYSLHELALEDCASRSPRAKIDDYDGYVFIVINTPSFDAVQHQLVEEKLCCFIGEEFVVTVCERTALPVARVRSALRSGKAFPTAQDVLYGLLDNACDEFLIVIDEIAEDISEMELQVGSGPDHSIPTRATGLKRVLTFLRRSAVQHREVIHHLLRMHPPFIDARLNLYFRDVYDHLLQSTELIETHRDLIMGIIEVNMSATAHRTNDIVKTLTIYATILLPLNVVTGYFGMNFSGLPLIHSPIGVPLITLILVCIVSATTFFFFRRAL